MGNDPRSAKSKAAHGQFSDTQKFSTAMNEPSMRYGTEPARFDNEVAFNDFFNHVFGFKM